MADQNNFNNQNNQAGGQSASPYSYNPQYSGGAQIGDASRAYGGGQLQEGAPLSEAPRPKGWYCSNCGTYQVEGVFCGNCGTPRSGVTTGQLMERAASAGEQAPFTPQPQEQYKPLETPRLDPTDPGFATPSPSPVPGNSAVVPVGKAIAALILGIFALFATPTVLLGLILAIVGLVVAHSFKKQGGKHGAATAGKVLCIVSLVLSTFWGALIVVAIAIAPSYYDDFDEVIDEIVQEGELYGLELGDENASGFDFSGGEQAKRVVHDTLEPFVAASDAAVKKLADDLSAAQLEDLGFSFEEMGIDPMKLAKWELDGFTYTISRCSLSSDGQSATALAQVKMRDLTSFYEIVTKKTALLNESDYSSLPELYHAVGDIWDEASGMVTFEEDMAVIPLVKKNGVWALDQERWVVEYRRLFAI
ncbi:MAG: DUF4190 domain-containing protein [Eggerthellales bacterium]|nr:DUF4190 domain-containing protein [Eggerthellales bacterium]